MPQSPRRPVHYCAGALVILLAWILLALALLHRESFDSTGPLSLHQLRLRAALPGGPEPERVLQACFPQRSGRAAYKVVGGPVDGRDLYACYQFDPDGTLTAVKVVDADGIPVQDVEAIKQGGGWPWVGAVNSGDDVVSGVLLIGLLLLLTSAVYGRARPAPEDGPRWIRPPLLWLLLAVPVVGWVVLLTLRGLGEAQRWWLFQRIALVALGMAAGWPALLLDWRVDPRAGVGD